MHGAVLWMKLVACDRCGLGERFERRLGRARNAVVLVVARGGRVEEVICRDETTGRELA